MTAMSVSGTPVVCRIRQIVLAGASACLLPSSLLAQAPAPSPDPALRFKIPPITVTAQKEEEDKQKIPVSVTAVPKDTIESAAIRIVSDAAIFAPNTYFTEWSARKLSTPHYRGISASPSNPAITTYFDGVPQISQNSSSIELLDVNQVEFVRGPQSALFGRNTLGGLVNITSTRPASNAWTGAFSVPFGNHGAWQIRGNASGPVVKEKVSLGVSFAQVVRDGFTVNDITGHTLDDRSAFSAKGQVLWTPSSTWETRVIVNGERARDGDYALNDVAQLRSNPFHAARDFEGWTNRDIFATTIQARHAGPRFTFSSTTGFVNWETEDATDLDYTPLQILRRDNAENDFQFTQELRFASADSAPIRVADSTRLQWQAGVSLFTQNYEQDAVNSYSPFVVAPIAVSQHTPRADLDDVGFGVFGQTTFTVRERLDLVAGARVDYESKSALLETFFEPAIVPPTTVDTDESFSNVSPQVSVAYRFQPDTSAYFTVANGYKAGGFNPASPAGSESYGEEHTWNFEGGLKMLLADGRVSANLAVFHIDWEDLQLNLPGNVPGQFYIANVGGAASTGVELEINARAAPGVDVFTSVGVTNSEFSDGSSSSGVNVAGNKIPNVPEYTASAGLQYGRAVGRAALVGRADVVFYGAFQYNDQNSLGQEAFSLVNLRFGVTAGFLTGELLMRNAFDTHYIPIAFPYPGLAPSGFVGEMGAPRTFIASAGVKF